MRTLAELADMDPIPAVLAYDRILDALWLDPPHRCSADLLVAMIIDSLDPGNERRSLPDLYGRPTGGGFND